jgi:hypothetical protein
MDAQKSQNDGITDRVQSESKQENGRRVRTILV